MAVFSQLTYVSYVYTPGTNYIIYNAYSYPPPTMNTYDHQQCTNIENSYYGQGAYAFPSQNDTRWYNCHGYAWHMSNSSSVKNQAIWINYPDNYWSSGSYSTSTETNGRKAYYTYGDHSAVVLQQTGGNLIYRSKWGSCSLMIHPRNACPYYGSYINWYYRYGFNDQSIDQLLSQVGDKADLKWGILEQIPNIKGFNIYHKSDSNRDKLNSELISRSKDSKPGENEQYQYMAPFFSSGDYELEIVFEDNHTELHPFLTQN